MDDFWLPDLRRRPDKFIEKVDIVTAPPEHHQRFVEMMAKTDVELRFIAIPFATPPLIDPEIERRIVEKIAQAFMVPAEIWYNTPYIKPQSDPSQDHPEEGDPNASTSECSPVDPGC